MLFQIKICGITTPPDAVFVVQSGADAIGLNFYRPSKRYVTPETATQIAAAARTEKPETKIVGVFVNSSAAEIATITRQCNLDAIQLHGDELPNILGQLASELNREVEAPAETRVDGLFRREPQPPEVRPNLFRQEPQPPVLRAIRTNPAAERTEETGRVESEVGRVQAEIDLWVEAGIDAILLDAAEPGEFGGTGKNVDWSVVPALECAVSLILAGGLTPENVAQAIQIAEVSAVDVASGVESAAGIKSPDKVRKFCENAARMQI